MSRVRKLALFTLVVVSTSCDYSAKKAEAWKVVLRFYTAVSGCDSTELPQYTADGAFLNQPITVLQDRIRSTCSQRGTVEDFHGLGWSQIESDSLTTRGRLYCISYRMDVRYSRMGDVVENIRICSDDGEPGAPYRVAFYRTTW